MTWEGELRDSPRTAPQHSAYLPRAPDDPVSGDSSGHPSPARPQPLRAPSGSRGPEATRGPRAGGGHRTECGTRAGPWGPPPGLSFSVFPGLSGLNEPRGGARKRLERAQDAGPREDRRARGTRTKPPRALPLLPPRTSGRLGSRGRGLPGGVDVGVA